MPRIAFVLLCLLAVPTQPLSARDYYVNNQTGDDRFNGATPEVTADGVGPMRTIRRALKAAHAGDSIILAATGEPYRESVTLQGSRHGSNGLRPFRIVGNQAILDGTVSVASEAWRHEVGNVFSFQPHLLGHQQFYGDGKPLPQQRLESTAELADLETEHWAYLDGRIYFCAADDRLPQSYDLAYCGLSVGLTLYRVEGVLIEDLTVQGFQLDGINAHDNVFETQVTGCRLRGNGRSGLHVGGASRVEASACLIGNNAHAQVHTSDYCKLDLINCDLIESDPHAPPVVSLDKSEVSRESTP